MEDLIEKHMGLVLYVVNRFNPKNHMEKDAYIQAGRIGLWKALTKFSEKGGSKFAPYAWNPIRWEIIKEIRLSKKSDETTNLNDDWAGNYVADSESSFWECVPSTLTPLEDKVIQLRLEGYNFQEIASQLSCNRSRIRKIFNSAVEKIRVTNE